MNEHEQKAVLAICIMAAFADGSQSDLEREEIKRIAEGLTSQNPYLTTTYQEVLLQKVHLADVAQQLTSNELRNLAYEMAVCVCNADGTLTDSENRFLQSLRDVFHLDDKVPPVIQRQATAMVEAPLHATVSRILQPPEEAELDQTILHYAILNGALEMMPQSLATMAIIPLQMKMVYSIGKRYGFELGRGHIKDFLATVGVGLTSQVVENYARHIMGGLFRQVSGRLMGGLANQATGSAFSFATTYALGQVAKQYYSSGRNLTTNQLKQLFTSMLGNARALQSNYTADIAQKSRTLNVSQLLPLWKSS